MIILRDINEFEFKAYLECRIQAHAHELIKSGGKENEALTRAKQSWQGRLKYAFHSPEDYILAIIDEKKDVLLGAVWYIVNNESGLTSTDIHDFFIFNEFRGHSYGIQAMNSLECRFLELNIVFAQLWLKPNNLAGENLCHKCGFKTIGSFMEKKLTYKTSLGNLKFKLMETNELIDYLKSQIHRQAESDAEVYGSSLDDELAKSERDYNELFQMGKAPENTFLFSIINPKINSPIGRIWLGKHQAGPEFTVFIEDFEIFAEFRRKGYGNQALIALEHKAKDLGCDTISLFVQSQNQTALNLYRESGYSITGIEYKKIF